MPGLHGLGRWCIAIEWGALAALSPVTALAAVTAIAVTRAALTLAAFTLLPALGSCTCSIASAITRALYVVAWLVAGFGRRHGCRCNRGGSGHCCAGHQAVACVMARGRLLVCVRHGVCGCVAARAALTTLAIATTTALAIAICAAFAALLAATVTTTITAAFTTTFTTLARSTGLTRAHVASVVAAGRCALVQLLGRHLIAAGLCAFALTTALAALTLAFTTTLCATVATTFTAVIAPAFAVAVTACTFTPCLAGLTFRTSLCTSISTGFAATFAATALAAPIAASFTAATIAPAATLTTALAFTTLATAIAAFASAAITASAFARPVLLVIRTRCRGSLCSHGRRYRCAAKQPFDPAKEALLSGRGGHCNGCSDRLGCKRCGSRRSGLDRLWARLRNRRGHIRQHALDDRRLLVGRFLRAAGDRRGVFHLFGHFVAGLHMVQARVVVL